MSNRHPASLQTFVYRTLTLRLSAMALAIALLTGLAVYGIERQNLSAAVVAEGRSALQNLLQASKEIAADRSIDRLAALEQALDAAGPSGTAARYGNFVYASFYGRTNQPVVERAQSDSPSAAAVKTFIAERSRPQPSIGELAEIVRIDGRLHVHVVLEIVDQQQRRLGFCQAVYAPSAATLGSMEAKLVRSVLLAIAIVAATSLLLYPVIVHLVGKLVIFSRNLLDANLESLSILASAIAKRDSDTDVHNFRVTLYAVRLAESLQLSDSLIQSLVKGAFLHDVGKIGVRDTILLKAGRLDEAEFIEMKRHVQHGLDIVAGSNWLSDATEVVGAHHEKFDGTGYPAALAGDHIPLLARIFALADVFDALTSARPYKKPLTYEESMEILAQGRASHFDPRLLTAFTAISADLYQSYAGRDDQGLRDELKSVIAQYFSKGSTLLY